MNDIPFIDNSFAGTVTNVGKLMICRGGKQIMSVSADRFEPIVAELGEDDEQDQLKAAL